MFTEIVPTGGIDDRQPLGTDYCSGHVINALFRGVALRAAASWLEGVPHVRRNRGCVHPLIKNWSKAMYSIESEAATNEVTALFAASTISFGLSPGATLADLAERLDHFGCRETGKPQAIYLKFPWPGTAKCLMSMLSSETEGYF
jgi:hypothetical protein